LDAISNKEIIQKMIDIEKQLLQYYIQYFSLSYEKSETNIQNKTIIYNLKNQLQNGSIKYYKEYEYYYQKPSSFYIKFSGIWENQSEIGITFKLIEYQKKI
jgi:ribosomal protein RSM22 (predicted rRNA methylase)